MEQSLPDETPVQADTELLDRLQPAIDIARRRRARSVDTVHVLLADLAGEASLLREVARRCDRDERALLAMLERHDRLGRTSAMQSATRIARGLAELVRRTSAASNPRRALIAEILLDPDAPLAVELRAAGLKCVESDRCATRADSGPEPEMARDDDWPECCRDLTAMARSGELRPVIGRATEVAELVEILAQLDLNNAFLLGDPGVGKTALVEELARRAAAGEIPTLRAARFLELQIGALLAGTQHRGSFEARLQQIIDRAERSDGGVVLFVDEAHLAASAGAGADGPNMMQLLKSALGRGRLRFIAATTEEEYRRLLEPDGAIVRRFALLTVREPSREDTRTILAQVKARYEAHHGVRIDDAVLAAAVDLTDRHETLLCFPAKALRVLDRACARAALSAPKGGGAVLDVTPAHIAEVVATRCRTPLERLLRDGAAMERRAEFVLSAELSGQPHAMRRLSEVIRRAVGRPPNRARPFLVLHFVASEHVVAYDLPSTLARILAKDSQRVVRVAGAQLASEQACERLAGPAPGLVGYDQGGALLAEPVRRDPHAVVLFDQLELVHSQALALIEGVLETAELRDNHGRRVRFSECVILLVAPPLDQAPQLARALSQCDARIELGPLDDASAIDFATSVLRRGAPANELQIEWRPAARRQIESRSRLERHRPAALASLVSDELGRALEHADSSGFRREIAVDFDDEWRVTSTHTSDEHE